MITPIHVLGFSGSVRKGSYNTKLLYLATKMLPEGMTLEIFNLAPLPFYNADLEAKGFPVPVEDFRNRIYKADGLLIATPEYNASLPGILKNALDWASRRPSNAPPGTPSPLRDKPMAMMGAAGGSGSARAQNHLRQIAASTGMQAMSAPEVKIVRAGEKFDAHGNLIDDQIRESILALLEAFANWVRQLREGAI